MLPWGPKARTLGALSKSGVLDFSAVW
jgi:hypothetical protein